MKTHPVAILAQVDLSRCVAPAVRMGCCPCRQRAPDDNTEVFSPPSARMGPAPAIGRSIALARLRYAANEGKNSLGEYVE